MNRQFVRIGISALSIAISSVFFQNCSGGLNPVSHFKSSVSTGIDISLPPGTDPTAPAFVPLAKPLSCVNYASQESGAVIPEAKTIAAVGRLSTGARVGYLDEAGRVFVTDDATNQYSPKQIDVSQRYKWFGFEPYQYGKGGNKYYPSNEPVRCGLSVNGDVRCLSASQSTSQIITELAGSIQALMISGKICGLQTDGAIKCFDSDMKQINVTHAEGFLVLSQLHIFTTGYKSFESRLIGILDSLSSEDQYRRETHQVFLNTQSLPFYGEFDLRLCGAKLRANTVFGNRPTGYPGCAITEKGRAYCYYSNPIQGSGRVSVPVVTMNSRGEFRNEFETFDPDHRYLAIRAYVLSGLACGLTDQNVPYCFSLGFTYGSRKSASDLNLAITKKTLFTVDRPNTISHFLHDEYSTSRRGTIIRDGEALSWKRPAFDLLTNSINTPVSVDPSRRYKLLFQGYAYEFGFCGVTTEGSVRCLHSTYDPNSKSFVDAVVDMDPGVSYKTFFRTPQAACGTTVQNDLRCWYAFGLGKKAQNVILGKVIGHMGERFITSDNEVINPYVRAQPVRLRNAANQEIGFQETVSESGRLFRGTDGKVYLLSETNVAVLSSLDPNQALDGFKAVNHFMYFNIATQKCGQFKDLYSYTPPGGIQVQFEQLTCSGAGREIDMNGFSLTAVNLAPSQIYMGSYVRSDGAVFGSYNGEGSEVYFVSPQEPRLR